jgi:hypothetical protein
LLQSLDVPEILRPLALIEDGPRLALLLEPFAGENLEAVLARQPRFPLPDTFTAAGAALLTDDCRERPLWTRAATTTEQAGVTCLRAHLYMILDRHDHAVEVVSTSCSLWASTGRRMRPKKTYGANTNKCGLD